MNTTAAAHDASLIVRTFVVKWRIELSRYSIDGN
jgi:hypothetical protein